MHAGPGHALWVLRKALLVLRLLLYESVRNFNRAVSQLRLQHILIHTLVQGIGVGRGIRVLPHPVIRY